MPLHRHRAKSGNASIIGAIAGFLSLAYALFAAAFAAAGLIDLWLGLLIAPAFAIAGIALIVRHIRSHQETRDP